jgi:hypothetical protein
MTVFFVLKKAKAWALVSAAKLMLTPEWKAPPLLM